MIDHALSPMDPGVVETPLGTVVPQKLLGKGKSGYSHLALLGDELVVLKVMHAEPCSYYSFTGNKVDTEYRAYQQLQALNIPIPGLLMVDSARQFLLKKFVDGPVAGHWAPTRQELDAAVEQLFAMSRTLANAGLNIDYFPANFVVATHGLVYIDYEVNPYMEEWNLENWGLYYWANLDGMRAYSATGDWRHINQDATSGQPLKRGFEARVAAWRGQP